MHPLLGDAEPLEALEGGFDFLLAEVELALAGVEFFFAGAEFGEPLPEFGPFDFQFAGAFAELLGLAVELGGLSFETRFPLGDLQLAAIELADAVVGARFLGRPFFDRAIELALAMVELAMASFDGGFTVFETLAAFGPLVAIVFERGEALVELGVVAGELGFAVAEARFALVESLDPDVRELGGAGVDDRLAFG